MKIHTLGGKIIDFRRIKRLLGYHLRDYRSGKLPIDRWAGRRPPSATWRKNISTMNRQRNHQHRVNVLRAKETTMPDDIKQKWIERCEARYLAVSQITSADARSFAEECWESRLFDDDSPEAAADSDMSYWENDDA